MRGMSFIGGILIITSIAGCGVNAVPRIGATESSKGTVHRVDASANLSHGVVAEFNIPTDSSGSTDISSGPDGNLWFTENASSKVGKLTPAGAFTEYPVNYGPSAITVGPNRKLWFLNSSYPNSVSRMSTAGTIVNFSLFDIFGGYTNGPGGVARGPDDNLWITAVRSENRLAPSLNWIEVMTPSGKAVASYQLQTGFDKYGIAGIVDGSDGNLWFVETRLNDIGKITPSGLSTRYDVPTASSGLSGYIVRGPDGNIWFTENTANKIGKITPTGVITEYPIPSPGSAPLGITAGPDGNVWFTENSANKIAKITPTGVITEFPNRTNDSGPWGIAQGPHGTLWFVESNANKIAKFRP